MKKPILLYSDYYIYGVLLALVCLSLIIPLAFAEKIVYSNSYPVWYQYDCTQASPSSWTLVSILDSPANIWKYFSYYDGNCYATLHTFNFGDLSNLTNVTSITYYVDSRSLVLNDLDDVDPNDVDCQLYYFENVDTSGNISKTPTSIASSFECTETLGQVIESTIPFSVGNNATLTGHIQGGNFTQSFMLFPSFNATVRSNLDASNHNLAITKHLNAIEINGEGFNCVTIEASNWCNMYNEPWEAIKKALGEDYIGSWFYVFVFFPLPFAVFLISRNGLYAGFTCLPILLFINTIDSVVFEISLSLIALAGAFGFYEMLRKRLIE